MKIDVSRRIYGRQDLKWRDGQLRLCTGRMLATVEPDGTWVGMFRVRLPNGHLTDMVNLTRAKDAAISHALTNLNGPGNQETGVDGGSVRPNLEAAE
jgi:hypothetical protein